MRLGKRRYAAALSAVCLGGAVAACGDNITAQHSWYGLGVAGRPYVTQQPSNGGYSRFEHRVISGMLVDGPQEHVLPGTSFREDCAAPITSGGPPNAKPAEPTCTLALNVGQKFYVARGVATSGGYGTFKSLSGTGGTVKVELVKAQGVSSAPAGSGASAGVNQPIPNYLVRFTAKP